METGDHRSVKNSTEGIRRSTASMRLSAWPGNPLPARGITGADMRRPVGHVPATVGVCPTTTTSRERESLP
jgi:hypothetical protein